MLEGELQYGSKLTLQYQIFMIIKRNISSNNLKPGDRLPTEEEICKAFNVSRSTVRSAIGELEKEGLINRIRGKGTFVAKSKMKRKMENIYSFSHQMQAEGLVPSSHLLKFKKIPATRDFADIFEIEKGEMLYEFVRIRLADNIPLLLETSYMPVEIHPTLREEVIANGSLYDSLRDDANIVPFVAEETYESVVMEDSVCELLECPPRSSGFFIERIARIGSGKVYEFTQSFMRGDRSKISITLQEGNYSFARSVNNQ